MITIGFDGSRLATLEPTGTESYSAEILRAMAKIIGDDRLVVYLNQTTPLEIDLPRCASIRSIPFPRFWTHGRLSWEMVRHTPDVLFVPAHVVPVRHPVSVVTIHDLGYLVEPHAHPAGDRRRLDLSTRWSVHAARKVVAISDATRRALVGAYGIEPDKVRVVHHGVSERFAPAAPEAITRVASRYRLPERYVLAVGTIHPRKNLARLVQAMGRVRAAALPHRLVIAGRAGWLSERVDAEIAASGAADLVHRLGYVAPGDLPALYSGAEAFAFPSLYEGFGMPLLEAFACGVPAVVSDRGALPEIAGEAAIVANAVDPDAFGAAILDVLTSPTRRQALARAGVARAAQFRWDRAARETLAVIHEAKESRDR